MRRVESAPSDLADVPANLLHWSHQNQVNPKDLAEMMGHADVDTQFEYVVGDDEVKRAAAAKIGKELFSFVQISEPVSKLIN